MIALDKNGHVAAGTSTNGLTHKVPGCVEYAMFDVRKMAEKKIFTLSGAEIQWKVLPQPRK